MTMEEQFSAWVQKEKEEELLDYLQKADDKQRKELGPLIKKLGKHYNEYKDRGNGQWSVLGTERQREILVMLAFVCLPQKDFEKEFFATWMLDPARFNKIKNWYCPSWFGGYINRQAGQEYISHWLTYDWVMQLSEEGFLEPSKMLIAKILPNLIFETTEKEKQRVWVTRPDNLLKRPVTLQEHIWYLFEEETNIHYAGRYIYFGQDKNKDADDWITVLCRFTDEGKIDRKRLLTESLAASNRNFNKVLSGWFIDLFMALKATGDELAEMQPELFSLLASPHSKVVNEALSSLKKISGLKAFDTPSLLTAIPAVLSSKTKNTVASGLMLLEQAAKKDKQLSNDIAVLCCQAFVHADESLQTRAAKIISKYADKNDTLVPAALEPYHESLMQGAKKLLNDLMSSKTEPAADAGFTFTSNEATSLQPLPAVETTDDLVFLASQAFDNNASWHIDFLPAAIINMQHELKGPVLSQLQPALQRALKLIKSGLRSTQGNYDHMLAVFFIDVCVHLVRIHPADAKALNDVFDDHDQKKEGDVVARWMNIEKDSSYISQWKNHYEDPFYQPYKSLLTVALYKIQRGDTTPLLSTPTHEPGWIDAATLVQRIHAYQQKGAMPADTDAQMALARCCLQNTEAAIAAAKEKLDGEWQRLMLFLLQRDAEPEGPFTQPDAWMMASLSKWPKKMYPALQHFGYYENGLEKYSGQYKWEPVTEEFETSKYRYENGKFITDKVMDSRKQLLIYFFSSGIRDGADKGVPKKSLLQKLGLKKAAKTTAPPPDLLYDYFSIKNNYFTNEHNDIRRALLMAPNNAESFLPQIVRHCLQYPSFFGEGHKKIVIATLQLLHEIWDRQGGMAHLFLATSMIAADKTVAGLAAGIWLRYAPAGKADSALMGKIIGLEVSADFAPLKRFTDLALQSLFRVSPQHNVLLQTMIEQIIKELPPAPVTNLKKLLEIYTELLAANNTHSTDEAVKQQLAVWKGNAGLKKIIESTGV